MIYLISPQRSLWESDKYEVISPILALDLLKPLKECECDTETLGLDPYTKKLLTIQLGNKENQFVFDVSNGIYPGLKEYLESDRTFLFWNAQFDLMFLNHYNIWPVNIYDGMLVEQLIYLGYDREKGFFSLQESYYRYFQENIDKSVRGKIITEGLTERVVIYAAGDVMHLSDIRDKQMVIVKEEHLENAVKVENEFVKCLAYIKLCGAHLDEAKWKSKMAKDQAKLNEAVQELNSWVVNYFREHGGDEKTMTIDREYILDTQWEHDIKRLKELGIKKADLPDSVLFSGTSFKRDSGRPELGMLYGIKVKEKFPYLKIDYQGDLFLGFNTEPQCTINWSSPKQLIPFFEMLGFNLETFDKKTKEKKKSVGSDVIEKQQHVSTIAKPYLKYKEAAKIVTSFGENWLKAINPVSHRIHVDFHQLGTNTARLSSGGGTYKLNLQQLPRDSETRACFTAEKGNKWISCDYDSQESQLLASVANDPAMLDLYRNGCGDMHALVAYMSYPNIIPRDTKIEDISKLYHEARQNAKGIEFAINYGGDDNTISANAGIPKKDAKNIYDSYMKGFPGVKKYQDYCRKAVIRDGYILMNPVTGHRCHIPDWEELKEVRDASMQPGFWEYYREEKNSGYYNEDIPKINNFIKRKKQLEKDSINYRIQNRGAMCFKFAGISLYNWIKKNNLLGVVKICIPVHDEFNVEAPEEMAEEISKIVVKAMEKGAAPFCTRLHLSASPSIEDHWVH